MASVFQELTDMKRALWMCYAGIEIYIFENTGQ